MECELIAEQTYTADGPRVKVCRRVVLRTVRVPTLRRNYTTHARTHTHINPRRQIIVATKFCAVAPNIYWSSVWNQLAPIIVIWANLLETLCTLGQDVPPT